MNTMTGVMIFLILFLFGMIILFLATIALVLISWALEIQVSYPEIDPKNPPVENIEPGSNNSFNQWIFHFML